MKKIFLTFLCVLMVSQMSIAQTSSSSHMTGVRRGLATIMLAGLGGAILGLSTLSFYGEPQEHVGNIWTGLAAGLIGGSAYVLSQSQRSASTAAMEALVPPPPKLAHAGPPMFQYRWEF
jgi:hypothetical protein